MASTRAIFELVPRKLVFGGAALGYHVDRTVLVTNALPGEQVEVEALRETKGTIHARVRRLLTRSPARVEPPCPYFGDCGGCSYQHLSGEDQLRWKVAILRETLRRIGKLTWDREIAVHSAYPWYYRNQARLKLGSSETKHVEVGFFASESHRLVRIDACRILSPCLNATLAEASQLSPRSLFDGISAIDMMADDCDRSVMLRFCGAVQRGQGDRLASTILGKLPQVQTVAFEAGGKLWVSGKPSLSYRVGEFVYQVSPGSFFQASRFLLPELVKTVVATDGVPAAGGSSVYADQIGVRPGAAELHDRTPCALDLYAGVGLFSLPLSRRFNQVIAVESHSGSAADLVANADSLGLDNIRAVNQSVFDFLRRFRASETDLVVVDPPRAGVGFPILQLLSKLKPKSICYVSCHPPTLARDLSFLTQHGYTMTSIDLFDFFPQTAHLESVTHLQRVDLIGS
jgi:23S rRNA (uracil1939-C5)-methyltransferase